MNPITITARNVNHALSEALHRLNVNGVVSPSRVGDVIRFPAPLITTYENPTQRVLFSPLRNANPFFHFMESLWMLNGGRDLAWPRHFNKRFDEYSDNGETIHGAYGDRWREHFGFDQLAVIAKELHDNPNSRRAVLTMWNPGADLRHGSPGLNGKDVPCNTHAYFEVIGSQLDMTVCCRSNDLIWGAYGANAVHFSFLQEYMAYRVGAQVGLYRQFSNNAHVYTSILPRSSFLPLATNAEANDFYQGRFVNPFPLIRSSAATWTSELADFLANPSRPYNYREPFFADVAVPMFLAWETRTTNPSASMVHAKNIAAEDWRVACVDWLLRRNERVAKKISAAKGEGA